MRFEWLFLRWLVVIGLIALGASYAQSWQQSRPKTDRGTIALVHGAGASGINFRDANAITEPVPPSAPISKAEATLHAIVSNLSGQTESVSRR
jgi:hypothetical protein